MSSGALLPAPGEGESTVYRPCWALRGLWSVLGSPLRLLRRLFPGRTGSCVFCAVSQEKGFNVVLEDAQFVAFHDRSPAARVHLLVVPRKHWGNVAHWPATEESAARARAMHTFGQRALRLALEQQSGTDIEANLALPSDEKDWYDPDAGAFQRFGFHLPPFRSVEHAHLHCLALPFHNRLRAAKYFVSVKPDHVKGWGWFVTWAQAAALLELGNHVRLGAC